MAVKTRAARKRRLARAHAHQKLTRNTPPYAGHGERRTNTAVQATQHGVFASAASRLVGMRTEPVVIIDEPLPVASGTRAKCPVCEKSQKVRKDGTLGAHRAPDATVDCAGTGRHWDAPSS